MNYIYRDITPALERGAKYFPVIVVTGPRQSGKSTLCQHVFEEYTKYNFEDIGLRESVASDPKGFISNCGEKVIIDEVQNLPEIFSYIQIAVDENESRRFVLTGSSNFSLMERITQSLAGRAAMFTLLPMSLNELGNYSCNPTDTLLLNGFYPSVVIGQRPSDLFYPSYYTTYVERDVRDLMRLKNIMKFDTFVRLLAARVGTEFNASQIAKEAGVSAPTITEWLSILDTSYITYAIRPYHANINKYLTKMPKIYFYDTGLLCYLLGIESEVQYLSNPLRGAVFENMAMGELMKSQYNAGRIPTVSFYRERSGKEVDAMVSTSRGLHLYEIKAGSTFKQEYTANMKYVAELLPDVSARTVIYDGESYPPGTLNLRDI